MTSIATTTSGESRTADTRAGESICGGENEGTNGSHVERGADLDIFLAMEPDLRTIRGALAAFRVFAQSADPIDPAAIAVLTTCAGEAERRLTDLWREQVDRPP